MTTVTKTIGGGTLTVTPKTKPYNEVPNGYAFAVIKSDGSVITWGDDSSGGDSSKVAKQIDGTIDVKQIFSSYDAFAALRADGSVITWGDTSSSGDSSVYHYDYAKSAYIKDYSVAKQLDGTIDVIQIFSNSIYLISSAFAALRSDGSVITWGDAFYGGDSSVYHYDDATSTYVKDDSVASQLDGTIDVKQIFSNDYAFAALRVDGSVITWGDASSGGDSNAVTKQLDGTIDVKQIFSNGSSFAALRVDGSVITWGDASTGTGGDSSVTHVGYSTSLDIIKDYSVTKQLDGTIDVTQIFSTDYAFSALRSDGSVITWGDASSGGDSSAVTKKLNGTIDVTQIFSNDYAFAALRVDGSVVTWGDAFYGGDSSAVTKQLDGTIDVTQIYSNGRAFAALRVDGSVVTWGDDLSGGDSSVYHYDDAKSTVIKDYSVTKQLDGTIDVKQIYSNGYAFAALRVDGSVVTWGYYENSTQIPNKLNGVVSFADPSTDDIYKISTVTHSTITTSEDDVITGTSGRDTINGGLGNDTLTGGLGSDKFVFNTTLNAKTNVDTITDFVHDIDQIQLAKSIMTNIGNVGNINASTFTLSTQSLTAANRIIYDLSLGALSYDADGSGSIPAIQFAIIGVSTHPILSNTDFVIV